MPSNLAGKNLISAAVKAITIRTTARELRPLLPTFTEEITQIDTMACAMLTKLKQEAVVQAKVKGLSLEILSVEGVTLYDFIVAVATAKGSD